MRIVIVVITLAFIVFLATQIAVFSGRENAALKQYKNLQVQADKAAEERKDLEAELEYYSNPINLEKELRSRFNYRAPDEKMIIIVPPSTASSSR